MNTFEYDEYVSTDHWFEIVHHVISVDEFTHFHLQRRFGGSWWLLGIRTDRTEEEIGKIHESDLIRFIAWSELPQLNGSRITQISGISNKFDLLKDLHVLLNLCENKRK